MERVVLVDENDREIGTEEKIKAHKDAKLHRAFSILVFNSKGELLIQKRASSKYHTSGMWSNTCCSHPMPGENIEDAAHRKLKQEMGFDCDLERRFHFVYKVNFENGLWEHEFDHVLVGEFNGVPKINPEEAEEFKWAKIDHLIKDMERNPESYTEWFKIALRMYSDRK